MSALLADPLHLQLALGFGLCALALVSLVRPDIGLAVSGAGMVLMGSATYAELGPTSPQLTTAAIYLVGGLIAAGLSGMVRLRGAQAGALPRATVVSARAEWRSDFLDEILDPPALGRDEGDFGDYLRGAERPEPRRLATRTRIPGTSRPGAAPKPVRTNAWT